VPLWKRIRNSWDRKRALAAELLEAKSRHEQVLPVSIAQQRLWFLAQLEPNTAAYNIWVGLRLHGDLKREVLDHSLTAIVNRHEPLRTTFDVRESEPVQIVAPSATFQLAFTDLSKFAPIQIEPDAYKLALAETRKPFNLKHGPLFRALLIRLGPADHVLICVMHHIISDGWSTSVLVQELIRNYAEFSKSADFHPEPLTVQYGDYAAWQRQVLTPDVLQRQLAYWKSKLAGLPPLLNLPSDRVRPLKWSQDGHTQTVALARPVLDRLKSVAQSQDASFFMLMLAVFKVLLFRYSGQTDLVVGVPVAGRDQIETEPLIGCFVNTLALRTDLSGDPRFSTLLAQVRHSTLEAFANADVPFEQVVQELKPVRSPSYSPIFQVFFATTKAAVQFHSFAGLTATPYIVNATTSTFDLSMSLIEGVDDQWWISVEYNTSLFDYGRIALLMSHYQRLLSGVADNPNKRISEFDLNTGPESHDQLVHGLDSYVRTTLAEDSPKHDPVI
jgi:Condensation domain